MGYYLQKVVFSFSFLAVLSVSSIAQSPISVSAELAEDVVGSFLDETKGSGVLGKIDFGLSLSTEDAGLWKGGEFSLLVENTHGSTPSELFIDDLQVVSNIEAGDATVLYECYYKQSLSDFSVQLGLIDLNSDLQVTEIGSYFINSSFGVTPTASANQVLPIFPKPALGVLLSYNFQERLSVSVAAWDGDPGSEEDNPYNVKWDLTSDEMLYGAELAYDFSKDSVSGIASVKAGVVLQNSVINGNNQSYHLLLDKTIRYRPSGKKGRVDGFLQLGYSPDQYCDWYQGAGIAIHGVFAQSASDVFGFAVSNMQTETVDDNRGEMVLECTYSLPIYENVSIQPDFQAVFKNELAGLKMSALVGLLRVQVSL